MKKKTIIRFSAKQEQKENNDDKKTQSQGSLIKRIRDKEEEVLGDREESTETFADRLVDLTDQSEEVLMTMKTVFPLDLFPDTITIDPLKILIIQKYFFLSKSEKSIFIKDIIDTSVEIGPWTSTLEIVTKEDPHPVRISYIRTKDAEKAMKIIKGLVVARSEAPEVSKVEQIRQ